MSCFDMIKSSLGIGDLDLIFKVTARHNSLILTKKCLSACCLMTFLLECYRTCKLHKWDRANSELDFGDLDLIFKVTAS